MLLSYEAYNELGEEELEQYNQQELLLLGADAGCCIAVFCRSDKTVSRS